MDLRQVATVRYYDSQPSACISTGCRARWLALQPSPAVQRPTEHARRSRTKRWNDALAELVAVHTECVAWLDALPVCLRASATATALQDRIGLELDAIAAIRPPLGYGPD